MSNKLLLKPKYNCNRCGRLRSFILQNRRKEPTWHNGPVNSFGDIKNHIISTGGGIILCQKNIDFMKKMGIIVFLDINLTVQLKRVKYRKHRPLLRNSNLEEKLKLLKSERDTIYNNVSDYIIDVSNKDKISIVKEIEDTLS